jgi:ribosome-binding protein aMBF1 (putative translation factor)
VSMQAKFESLGPLLREARQNKGLTQLELSRNIGAHVSTVRRWENGLSSPDEWWIGALIRTLGREIVRSLGLSDAAPLGR